jgi:hypothetical protein
MKNRSLIQVSNALILKSGVSKILLYFREMPTFLGKSGSVILSRLRS